MHSKVLCDLSQSWLTCLLLCVVFNGTQWVVYCGLYQIHHLLSKRKSQHHTGNEYNFSHIQLKSAEKVLHVSCGKAVSCIEGDAVCLPWVSLWIWRLQTLRHVLYDFCGNRFGSFLVSADASLQITVKIDLTETQGICKSNKNSRKCRTVQSFNVSTDWSYTFWRVGTLRISCWGSRSCRPGERRAGQCQMEAWEDVQCTFPMLHCWSLYICLEAQCWAS